MFAKYQGLSSLLPSGYQEALTQPGRNIAAGISKAGDSIADAVTKYQAVRERDAIIRGKVEAVVRSKGDKGDAWLGSQSEDTQKLLKKFSEGKETHDDLLKLGSYLDASETLDAKAREEELQAVRLAHAKQQVEIGNQNLQDYKATGLALTAAAGTRGTTTTSDVRSPISPDAANAAISGYYSGDSEVAPPRGIDVSALTNYNAEQAAYRQEQSQPPMVRDNPAYFADNLAYEQSRAEASANLSRYSSDLVEANGRNASEKPGGIIQPATVSPSGFVLPPPPPRKESSLDVAKRIALAASARQEAEAGVAAAKEKLAALKAPERFIPAEKTLTKPTAPALSAITGSQTESAAPTNADRQVNALKALSAAGHSVTPGILKALKENYPDESVTMLPVKDTGAVVIMQDGKIAGVTAATHAAGEKQMQQFQANAQIFGDEMLQAESVLQKLEADGYNPTSNAWDRLTPTVLNSPAGKQYQPAMNKWIESVLRQRSGAAISKDEYTKAEKQYFPSYGDTKAVIDQKRAMRATATTAMQAAVLGAREHVFDANGKETGTFKAASASPNAPDFIFQNGKMVKNPNK